MKGTYITTLRTILSLPAVLLFMLTASCVRDRMDPVRENSSRELKLSVSIDDMEPMNGEATKSSASLQGRVVDSFELRSADGAITIPVTVTESDGLPKEFGCTVTKGGLINDSGQTRPLGMYLDSITLRSFCSDTQANLFAPDAVSAAKYDGTDWSMVKNFYWPQATGLDIYAYANMPAQEYAVVTVDNPMRTQILDYTVPSDAKDQTDILMAAYNGTGDASGEADIVFHHPLTAVQFKRNTAASEEMTGIVQITMGGVNYHGTAVQSLFNPAEFTWDVTDESTTVSQDNNGMPFEVHGEIDGDPFLLIPQKNIGGRYIELTVIVVFSGHQVPLNAIITQTNWLPGKTYTYNINFVGFLESRFDMASQSELIKSEAVIYNTGTKKIYVRATAVGYIKDTDGNIKGTWLDDEGHNRGTFTVNGGGSFGSAEGWNSHWVAGPDGFWYYTLPLEYEGDESAMKTTPLFDGYSITDIARNEQFELLVTEQSVEWDADKDYVKATWGDSAAELLN